MEETIQAGSKYVQEVEFPAYAGYLITKTFNNQGNLFTIEATEPEPGRFVFSETATSDWIPGDYFTCVYATLGIDRFTVKLAKAKITPDLTASPVDSRSHVQRVLEALEAMIDGKATKDQQSMAIAGRSLVRYEIGELLNWRNRYKSELLRIDRSTGNAATTGKIYTRF